MDAYIRDSQSTSIQIQMEAIKNAIRFFSHQSNLSIDCKFIENFPKNIYEEFERMSEGETDIAGCQEKKILFFDVFTFIFRNRNLVSDFRAQPFIHLLLKYIKIRNGNKFYSPILLIESIKYCTLHETNKVYFINENGMFNFYYNSYYVMANSTNVFWKIFESIYNLNKSHRSSLIHVKLTDSVSQIITQFSVKKELKCLGMLIIVLMMVRRLKLLNLIELDFDGFYTITELIYTKKLDHNNYHSYLDDLSKIWIYIIKGS
ncbi:hypothetical protein RF11_16461 [Thelohanellus kitauei]|uniref:Uncharacterized protein n=1 Tax=Thelohanellus kitauei TaxID=669202 RepID=A0A0C2J0W6_THEKT|nr:hypothetical protein RF11_16461 [Thelohanellus kitauei]